MHKEIPSVRRLLSERRIFSSFKVMLILLAEGSVVFSGRLYVMFFLVEGSAIFSGSSFIVFFFHLKIQFFLWKAHF